MLTPRQIQTPNESMTEDSQLTRWELFQGKRRAVGLLRVLCVVLAKLCRPWFYRWRVMQAQRPRPTSCGMLVRALQVQQQELPDRVIEIKEKFAARVLTGPADAAMVQALCREQAPDELAVCLRSADRLCEHVFDILGSGPQKLGERIDWHRDFKSGYRWDETEHYLAIRQAPAPGADLKVPWELSRCQHLPVLAQAYLLSADERYVNEIVTQLADWIDNNPFGRGVNWACPMEVAIRAVNWLWTLGLIAESPVITTAWLMEVLASLIAHGRHLMINLERRSDGITTNHYLADVVGLLYLGVCLPECRDSVAWRRFALRELVREMERQVLPDGVHYESSISYHRLVCEMFLSSALLCRHHDVPLPESFHRRLQLMCEFVVAYTKPNGLAPQVGDGDNGRLHILTGYGTVDQRDHRHLLAAATVLYERDEWWRAAGPRRIEALWLGKQGRDRFAQAPHTGEAATKSAAFPHGGFYIMRDHRDYVLFNCNPVGTKGVGTHKHNDILALEVQVGGEDILVDPGTFLYTADPQAYDRFRGTASHSTVTIDAREQNRFIPRKFFCLHEDGRPRVVAWNIGRSKTQVSAVFDGYQRLADPISHHRDVLVHQPGLSVQVIDHFSGKGSAHWYEWTFTCAPGCRIEATRDGWVMASASQLVSLTAPRMEPEGELLAVTASIIEGWVAPSYGRLEPACWLRWRWHGSPPFSVGFNILKTVGNV